MICKELGALFVHIPKAAGQSIERVLLSEMGLSWGNREAAVLARNCDPSKGPPRLAHLTAEEYVKCNWLSADDFSNMFKFAFVRNPWARLVSEYRYRNLGPRVSFRNFVLSSFPGPADDNYSNGDDYYRHVIPQSRFIADIDGKCLVDFIGRFENLESDFRVVAERLNLATKELPHSNASSRHTRDEKDGLLAKLRRSLRGGAGVDTYHSFYDAETKGFVEEIYAEDLWRFEYKF